MQRESTPGRALWIALLIVLGGYVVSDFARSPFLASRGAAAVRPAEATLWVPAGEAGGETGIVAESASAGLELQGHRAVVKSLTGGSSQAVAEFLSRPRAERGTDLLVISSATLADLARDRHDRLVPGAAEGAVLARALLRRAAPVGVLSATSLAFAVPEDSSIQGPAQLLTAIREAPAERLFAIGNDTWSRVQLAALVDGAGVDGNVRFTAFHSGSAAAQAVAIGDADTVLAARSGLREDILAGQLRELAWPLGPAPRSSVAVVAPPGLPPAELGQARAWIAALHSDPRWLAQMRESGRDPEPPEATDPADSLAAALAEADRLELLAQQVERR